MPTPEETFVAIRSQLEKVGITITPVADQWSPNYLDKIQGTPNHGLHLLGWTGDYNDTDNFVGVFFGKKSSEWGFDNQQLFTALTKARGIPTRDDQTPAYEDINRQVMDFLPGIPLAHPVPSLAFASRGEGLRAVAGAGRGLERDHRLEVSSVGPRSVLDAPGSAHEARRLRGGSPACCGSCSGAWR